MSGVQRGKGRGLLGVVEGVEQGSTDPLLSSNELLAPGRGPRTSYQASMHALPETHRASR